MKISFTGTRKGTTAEQGLTLERILYRQFCTGTNHQWLDGDAIGADSQAHAIIVKMKTGGLNIETHGYPCNIPNQRAYNEFDVLHEVKPPLVRNRLMVDFTSLLIATPFEYEDVPRGSGTWATIRYAERQKKKHILIYPDGTFEVNVPNTVSWSRRSSV